MRRQARKFGQAFANQIRHRRPYAGDERHSDEVTPTSAGAKCCLCQPVDQDGLVRDILVPGRRAKLAAKRPMRKLLRRQGRTPRDVADDSWRVTAPPRAR